LLTFGRVLTQNRGSLKGVRWNAQTSRFAVSACVCDVVCRRHIGVKSGASIPVRQPASTACCESAAMILPVTTAATTSALVTVTSNRNISDRCQVFPSLGPTRMNKSWRGARQARRAVTILSGSLFHDCENLAMSRLSQFDKFAVPGLPIWHLHG